MTSPRIYLHIGAPKTGSTAIQACCANNRAALLAHGILYPEVSLRGYGHHDMAFLLAGGYPDWATPQPRPLEELLSELETAARTHAGDLLLSSENFYLLADPVKVRAGLESAGALAGRQPVILVYLRRQDEAHASWYNQTIKAQGYTHTFEECLTAFGSLFDYHERLRLWADAFGTESIKVQVFAPESFPGGDIRLDFLNRLGLPKHGFALPPQRQNLEINADLLEFQRTLNRLPLTAQKKRRFLHRLMELSLRSAGLGLFSEGAPLDITLRQRILADHEVGNAIVARTFLGRDRLFAPLDPNSVPPRARSELTPEKLACTFFWLMDDQGAD